MPNKKILETREVTRNGVTLRINLVKGNKRNNWQLGFLLEEIQDVVDFFGDEAHLVIGSSLKHWFNIIQGREGAEYLLAKLEGEGQFFGRAAGTSKKKDEKIAEANAQIESMKEMLRSKGVSEEEIEAALSPKTAEPTSGELKTLEEDINEETEEEDIEEEDVEEEEERELAIA